jgi:hypothetical protein
MKHFDILRTLYKVSDFVSWQKAKSLVLSPSFQRRPVWKTGAKSYFIDTIDRGLPIPIIFLREQKTDLATLEPKREVVDGQQRIRTVLSYIDPNLLDDFKPERDLFTFKPIHNHDLGGKTFSELSQEIKQRIMDYQFSVHVLPSRVDDREILHIFARMNATGYNLNDQELRNAWYFGEFKTSMYELASEQLPRWRDWKIFTEYNIARMDEVELTSEFAILMLKGITGKNKRTINRMYQDKDPDFIERLEIENRFRIIMDTIDDKLGNEIRHLPFRKKTLFYSLFAFFYDIQFGLKSPLEPIQRRLITSDKIAQVKLAGERIESKNAPVKVIEAVARRTTHPSSRLVVLRYLKGEIEVE